MEFRFVITDAHSATSFPTGTTWCTADIGAMQLNACMPQTIFPSSPAACAQHHVRVLVFWESTKTRCQLSKLKLKSLIMHGMKVGCSRSSPAPKQVNALRWLVLVLQVLQLRSNLRVQVMRWLFLNAPTVSVDCCAMEFPNSRWKRSTSIDA